MSSFNTGVIINKGPIVLRQKAYSHNNKDCMDCSSHHQFKEINVYPCNSWPLPKCGLYQQLAFTNRWSLPTGYLYQQLAFSNRWSLQTGYLYQQLAFSNSWPFPIGGLYQQVVFTNRWSLPAAGRYQKLAFTSKWSLYTSHVNRFVSTYEFLLEAGWST